LDSNTSLAYTYIIKSAASTQSLKIQSCLSIQSTSHGSKSVQFEAHQAHISLAVHRNNQNRSRGRPPTNERARTRSSVSFPKMRSPMRTLLHGSMRKVGSGPRRVGAPRAPQILILLRPPNHKPPDNRDAAAGHARGWDGSDRWSRSAAGAAAADPHHLSREGVEAEVRGPGPPLPLIHAPSRVGAPRPRCASRGWEVWGPAGWTGE
jgi:hypothetical protein